MADENNQNMQEVLMLPGVILVLSVIIVIALIITSLVPSIRGYMEAQGQYKTLLSEQSTKEQTLESLRAAKEAEEKQQESSSPELAKNFSDHWKQAQILNLLLHQSLTKYYL